MTVKGYTDLTGRHNMAIAILRQRHGQDYTPPFGWAAFLGVGHEHPYSAKCDECGSMAYETLPYGKDPSKSVCEACAARDPEMAERRWQEAHPDG